MQFQDILDEGLIDFDQKLSTDVSRLLIKTKLRVLVAESMTGGLLAYSLMQHPGSSRYFWGGIVCYNNLLKIKCCGVKPKTLATHQAVSEEVVREMATGIKQQWGGDIGIAITGEAGPKVAIGSPVPLGAVCVAISMPKHTYVKSYQLSGPRHVIIADATKAVLGLLREYLKPLEGGQLNG